MDIRSLGMYDFPKKALPGHLVRGHLEKVIIAVLQLDAVTVRLLGRIDQLPALLNSQRSGHLQRHMLSLFHGIYADGCMQVPMGAHIHQVHVGPLAHLLPVLNTGISLGFGESHLFQGLVGTLHIFRHHIA